MKTIKINQKGDGLQLLQLVTAVVGKCNTVKRKDGNRYLQNATFDLPVEVARELGDAKLAGRQTALISCDEARKATFILEPGTHDIVVTAKLFNGEISFEGAPPLGSNRVASDKAAAKLAKLLG